MIHNLKKKNRPLSVAGEYLNDYRTEVDYHQHQRAFLKHSESTGQWTTDGNKTSIKIGLCPKWIHNLVGGRGNKHTENDNS